MSELNSALEAFSKPAVNKDWPTFYIWSEDRDGDIDFKSKLQAADARSCIREVSRRTGYASGALEISTNPPDWW
jgi:hypothetical protein